MKNIDVCLSEYLSLIAKLDDYESEIISYMSTNNVAVLEISEGQYFVLSDGVLKIEKGMSRVATKPNKSSVKKYNFKPTVAPQTSNVLQESELVDYEDIDTVSSDADLDLMPDVVPDDSVPSTSAFGESAFAPGNMQGTSKPKKLGRKESVNTGFDMANPEDVELLESMRGRFGKRGILNGDDA